MSLVTRSLPGLFGGVSQQIPAMRHPTQCSEQLNGFATLVDGLYKRPGTKHHKTLALTGTDGASVQGSYGLAYAHIIDKGSAGLYQLILVNGNLMLYSLPTGTVQTVDFPDGRLYLQTPDPENDFRCVTVADYTFIVNASKVTAMAAATGTANPVNVAYVNVKTAVVKVAYTISLGSGTTVTATYTTGDSPTNRGIADKLVEAINEAAAGYTAFVMGSTNCIKIIKNDGTAILCSASDGWANQALQTLTNGVEKYSDLPARFEPGYTLKVNGSSESQQDPYYVEWDGGKWVEAKQPGIADTLQATTMPHQLRRKVDGTWVFEKVSDWGKRAVGDDETNPVPSFIGQPIRGVFFFRNRLGFLAGDAVVLSRAGKYFNFWAATATQVLDTDPIDLASPAEQVETLDWAVPYNQSLLVWATSKQQFVLTGDDVLSPKTARLMPSTTFDAYGGARPATLGNRVLFASTVGSNCQINLYRVSEDQVTNTAEDVTEHVPTYVPAEPLELAASTAVRALVVVPRGPSKELKLLKYEWDERDRLSQRAWSTIAFSTADTVRILKAHWQSRTLYLLLHVTSDVDPVAGGRFVVESLDFEETATDTNLPFGLRLDRRVQVTGGAYASGKTDVVVPYVPSMLPVILRCDPGEEPELLTVSTSTVSPGTMTATYKVVGDHTGKVLWVGMPYTFRYTFTEAMLRDGDGMPVMNASVKLVRYLLRYVSTGWFTATVKPFLRGVFTYPFNGRTIGQPGQGPSELSLSTGNLAIPVQTRAESVEVSLESDSHLPCKFPYAEWVGDITMKAGR